MFDSHWKLSFKARKRRISCSVDPESKKSFQRFNVVNYTIIGRPIKINFWSLKAPFQPWVLKCNMISSILSSKCILIVHPRCTSSLYVLNVCPQCPHWTSSIYVLNVRSQCTSLMYVLNVRPQCVSSICVLNVRPQYASSMYVPIVCPQCVSSNVFPQYDSWMCVLNVCPQCVS